MLEFDEKSKYSQRDDLRDSSRGKLKKERLK